MIKHMQQVGGILTEYSDSVFTLQGLFVGNWGELNGTKYADQQSLQQLAKQLVKSTDSQMYLAVRTPVQWRKILESADADLQEDRKNPLYDRLGLFNDGMLGSGNDCGTYGEKITGATAKLNDVESGDHPEVTLTYTGTGYDGTKVNVFPCAKWRGGHHRQ